MMYLLVFDHPFNLICHLITAETVTVNDAAAADPVSSPSLHDLQIYGIIVTISLSFVVFGGVKMINRVAPAFLLPVIYSLCSIYLGILLAGKDSPASKCIQFGIILHSTYLSKVHTLCSY